MEENSFKDYKRLLNDIYHYFSSNFKKNSKTGKSVFVRIKEKVSHAESYFLINKSEYLVRLVLVERKTESF
jgi:hypothetical protein